jgi:hypothetical protein
MEEGEMEARKGNQAGLADKTDAEHREMPSKVGKSTTYGQLDLGW